MSSTFPTPLLLSLAGVLPASPNVYPAAMHRLTEEIPDALIRHRFALYYSRLHQGLVEALRHLDVPGAVHELLAECRWLEAWGMVEECPAAAPALLREALGVLAGWGREWPEGRDAAASDEDRRDERLLRAVVQMCRNHADGVLAALAGVADDLPEGSAWTGVRAACLVMAGEARGSSDQAGSLGDLRQALQVLSAQAQHGGNVWRPLLAEAQASLGFVHCQQDQIATASEWFAQAVRTFGEEPTTTAQQFGKAVAAGALLRSMGSPEDGATDAQEDQYRTAAQQAGAALDAVAMDAPPLLLHAVLDLYQDLYARAAEWGDGRLQENILSFSAVLGQRYAAFDPARGNREWGRWLKERAAWHQQEHGNGRQAVHDYFRSRTALLEAISHGDAGAHWLLAEVRLELGHELADQRLYNDATRCFQDVLAQDETLRRSGDCDAAERAISLWAQAHAGLAKSSIAELSREQREHLLNGVVRTLRSSFAAAPQELIKPLSLVEGELLAIYANEHQFDRAREVVQESMQFLYPFAEKDPEALGDVYGMEAKYLIKLHLALKDQHKVRPVAEKALRLARNPVVVQAFRSVLSLESV